MQSALDRFRTSGALKLLFPRTNRRLDGILVNTSGGLTSGDRMDVEAHVGSGAELALTTQAAERAYRADSGAARVRTRITVANDASLLWMPQELILYDGAALERDLRIDLGGTARVLMVEPVVFGRAAMGETLGDVAFRDRITITRDARPLYRDVIRFAGDVQRQMQRGATGRGAGAVVSVVYIAPDAEAHLDPVRAQLPETGGATLLTPDMLVMRLVAADSFLMRRHLLPVLDRLSGNTLPISWRL